MICERNCSTLDVSSEASERWGNKKESRKQISRIATNSGNHKLHVHLGVEAQRRSIHAEVEEITMRMTMRFILCLAITMLFISTVALGQGAPLVAPKKTDSTFVTQVGDPDAGNLGIEVQPGDSIRFTIKIDRVVSETDDQGRLLNFGPMLNKWSPSGTPYIIVKLLAFDIDSEYEENPQCKPRERDEILINGVPIGQQGESVYLKGKDRVWRLNTFKVPAHIIHYGKYQNGQWQGAGENQFEIKLTTLPYPCGDIPIQWSAKVKWASITVNAVYPVIMIHGVSSSGAFFTANNFTTPFQDQGIVYDKSIQLSNNSIEVNGNQLAGDIPRIARDKFHVKHVHIVAHSYGGISSRDFLARPIPKGDISILSLTTLDSPHHGTPGADYSEDSVGADDQYSTSTVRVLAAQARGHSAATHDLRVSYMEGIFNSSNSPNLPDSLSVDGRNSPVRYFAFGSDADANHNGNIEFEEYTRMSPFDSAWGLGGYIGATKLYRLIGGVKYTKTKQIDDPADSHNPPAKLTIVVETPNTSAPPNPTNIILPNDLVVTVNSAQHPKFTFLGPKAVNHSMIGSPGVAREVITTIFSVSPINQ